MAASADDAAPPIAHTPGLRASPRQARSQQTRERLLDVAGTLLAEVGIERISTNMIAARAGMTPPALYRYFDNVYALLEALGRRLMDRQDAVLRAWIERCSPHGLEALVDGIGDLLRDMAEVTKREPGGPWTMRALRAIPQFTHVRRESHDRIIEWLTEGFAPFFPAVERAVIHRRAQLATLGVIQTMEVALDYEIADHDVLMHELTAVFHKLLLK